MRLSFNKRARMKSPEDRLAGYLAEHGLRFTEQRRSVLRKVFETHRHFTADELCEELERDGTSVSRATVYRTLKHLVECDLVKEVFQCSGRTHYEHIMGHGHHDHMMCIRCGKVIEFEDSEIEKEQRRICRQHDFTHVEHRLGIRGICSECREKEGRDNQDDSDT